MPKKKAAQRTARADGGGSKNASAHDVCSVLVGSYSAAAAKLGLLFDFPAATVPFVNAAVELTKAPGETPELHQLRKQLVMRAQDLVETHAPPREDLSGGLASRQLRMLLYSFFQQVLWSLGLHKDLRSSLFKLYQQRHNGPSTDALPLFACLGMYGLCVASSREALTEEEVHGCAARPRPCRGANAAAVCHVLCAMYCVLCVCVCVRACVCSSLSTARKSFRHTCVHVYVHIIHAHAA